MYQVLTINFIHQEFKVIEYTIKEYNDIVSEINDKLQPTEKQHQKIMFHIFTNSDNMHSNKLSRSE